MKPLVFLLLLLPGILTAQALKPVDAAGSVSFVINNFGAGVDGSFSGLKGSIEFDPNNLSAAKMLVSVEAASIETGINMRNRHLRGEKYFNTEKFPLLSLAGSALKSAGAPNSYTMTANLTIKGVTKRFLLNFTAREQKDGVLFEGKFSINRRDFGVGGSSISLSDDVVVRLKVLAR